jgi:hypothetical protein
MYMIECSQWNSPVSITGIVSGDYRICNSKESTHLWIYKAKLQQQQLTLSRATSQLEDMVSSNSPDCCSHQSKTKTKETDDYYAHEVENLELAHLFLLLRLRLESERLLLRKWHTEFKQLRH